MQKLHILAIGVHPDDIELSSAGTLIKHAQMGQATGIIDLTRGELGTRGTPELRVEEANAAAKVMGVQVRENLGWADGFFVNDKEHQLHLVKYIRKYQPDIVIANALEDRHPDHGRAGDLIRTACFLAGLVKVETELDGVKQQACRPKRVFHMIQDRQLEPTFIVDISEVIEQKMEAILCYKSQFHTDGMTGPQTYISGESFLNNIRYRNSLWGKMIGTSYGEGFISENLPGVSDLDHLIYPEKP